MAGDEIFQYLIYWRYHFVLFGRIGEGREWVERLEADPELSSSRKTRSCHLNPLSAIFWRTPER